MATSQPKRPTSSLSRPSDSTEAGTPVSIDEPDPPKPQTEEPIEKDSVHREVTVTASGPATLPSGASFLLQPGDVLMLSAEDADHLVATGRASERS